MAAMTDLATPAAAVSAGYAKIQIDRGATPPAGVARYATIFEKWLLGEPGCAGFNYRVVGVDPASAANADTNALANLNAQRTLRYGKGTNQHNGANPANAAWNHVVDTT